MFTRIRHNLIQLLAGRDMVVLNARVGGDVGVANEPGQPFLIQGNRVNGIKGLNHAIYIRS